MLEIIVFTLAAVWHIFYVGKEGYKYKFNQKFLIGIRVADGIVIVMGVLGIIWIISGNLMMLLVVFM